jgi:hypothetical protein
MNGKQQHSETGLWNNIDNNKLRDDAFEAPAGYYNTLSLQLQNRIFENNETLRAGKYIFFKKPVFYLSAAATVIVLLVTGIWYANFRPSKPIYNEQAALQMMYDASYAEEALIIENQLIETELAVADDKIVESAYVENMEEASQTEITNYLLNEVNESELIIENQ